MTFQRWRNFFPDWGYGCFTPPELEMRLTPGNRCSHSAHLAGPELIKLLERHLPSPGPCFQDTKKEHESAAAHLWR